MKRSIDEIIENKLQLPYSAFHVVSSANAVARINLAHQFCRYVERAKATSKCNH